MLLEYKVHDDASISEIVDVYGYKWNGIVDLNVGKRKVPKLYAVYIPMQSGAKISQYDGKTLFSTTVQAFTKLLPMHAFTDSVTLPYYDTREEMLRTTAGFMGIINYRVLENAGTKLKAERL